MDARYLAILSILFVAGCMRQTDQVESPTTGAVYDDILDSVESTTTSSTTTSTTTTSTTTTTSQTTTSSLLGGDSCEGVCASMGYVSGSCRRSIFECRLNNEAYSRAGSKHCPQRRYDTCCCTDDPGKEDVVVHYRYPNLMSKRG